jgi:rhomboid-like protein
MRNRSFLVTFLISLNLIVFIAWHITSGARVEWMSLNFLVSWEGLAAGRYWTLLTSVFSHITFWHILANMFVLNSFGPVMVSVLGARSFLKFYVVAGIVSSLCHAVVSAWILGQPELPALGASGAISGLILLFSLMFPKQRIYIFGLVPVPALAGALVFVGLDIWGLISQAEGGGLPIGHGAHLGGALAGGIYYFMVIRRRRLSTFQSPLA